MSALPDPVPNTAHTRAIQQNLMRAAAYRSAGAVQDCAVACLPINRAAVNRANAQHSTRPRTEAGKARFASAGTWKLPPPCWNSISTKDNPGRPPAMGSFLQKSKSNAPPAA
jgi:hypothetical protein